MSVFTYDEEIFSDIYKDVNGFRPRSHRFYDASPEEKQIIWDSLIEDLNCEFEHHRQMQLNNIDDFERLVSQNIEMGASDHKTAVQWLVDAEGDEDLGYIKYVYGLPSDYKLF